MISAFVNEKHDNWDKLLPSLAFAYNTAVHGTTKCTPFEIIYGRKPKVPIDLICQDKKVELFLTPENYAVTVQKQLQDAFKAVNENRKVEMDYAKLNHDRKVRAANFELNDLVWILDPSKSPGKSKKLKKKWNGPFRITAIINDVDYMIKPANRNGKSRIVHQNLLKKCFGAKITSVGCSDVQLPENNNTKKKDKKVKFNNKKNVTTENVPVTDENPVNKRKRGRPKKLIGQESNNNVSNSSIDIQRQNKNLSQNNQASKNQAISNSQRESNTIQSSNEGRFPKRSRKKPDRYDSRKLYP
jgi:hypothetical protein